MPHAMIGLEPNGEEAMNEHADTTESRHTFSVPSEARVANCPLSLHGWQRLTGRGFTKSMIRRTIDWGRVQYSHGRVRIVLGHNEMRAAARHGVDLKDCVGIHVIQLWDGEIVSAYRNQKLKGPDTGRRARGRGRR